MRRTITIELPDLSDAEYRLVANLICTELEKLAQHATLNGGAPLRYWLRHDRDPDQGPGTR